jgi:hypothetical protein
VQLRHVVGGGELPSFHCSGDVRARHVADVTVTLIDRADLGDVDVEAGDLEARLGELYGERQADITEPDDADAGLFVSYLVPKLQVFSRQ